MKSISSFLKIKLRATASPVLLMVILFSLTISCTSQKDQKKVLNAPEKVSYKSGEGLIGEIVFQKGPEHNHPLMAFWLEDVNGDYIQTLYVAKSIGTGIFGHGKVSGGSWQPGPVSRPAALPNWWHKYGYLPTPERPVPDAISGPTPQDDFIMEVQLPADLPDNFDLYMEINQSWDWNEYWTNDRYPDNEAYMTSSQPAVVYKASITEISPGKKYEMRLVGHSHYAGENGDLYEDITSLTTARQIVAAVVVSFKEAAQ